MNVPFTLSRIRSVEFFVCYDTPEGNQYWQIPVDDNVQTALREMLSTTVEHLDIEGPDFETFSMSQHYGSTERLVANIDADVMQHARTIYELQNIETNSGVLRDTGRLAFYFAEFRDDRGRKLLGIRRATQFKGMLRARSRLVSLVDDSLKLVDEDIFRLDQEFDFIATSRQVLILRPSGFEYIAVSNKLPRTRQLREHARSQGRYGALTFLISLISSRLIGEQHDWLEASERATTYGVQKLIS